MQNCEYLFHNCILQFGRFFLSKLMRTTTDTSLREILLPISSNTYWYVTQYIVLLIISPLLNAYVENTSKNKFEYLLSFYYCVFCCIPTIIPIIRDTLGDGYNTFRFLFLYLLASYYRKFGLNICKKYRICFLFGSIFITYASAILLYYTINNYSLIFFNYNSPFVVLASMLLFTLLIERKKREWVV